MTDAAESKVFLGFDMGRCAWNRLDLKTFAPISTIINVGDGSSERWDFRDGMAEGHIMRDGRETVSAVPISTPSYDFNCCMRAMLLMSLPLSAGKTFILPAAVIKDGDPSFISYHVRGRERLRTGRFGTVETWVVDSPVAGGGEETFWIASKTKTGAHFDDLYEVVGIKLRNLPVPHS